MATIHHLKPAYAAHHPRVRDRLRSMFVTTAAEGYAACRGAIKRGAPHAVTKLILDHLDTKERQ
jgi:hypothetical protein